jgi:hypothetical protein
MDFAEGMAETQANLYSSTFPCSNVAIVERADPKGLSTFSQNTEFLPGIQTHVLQIWS